MKKILFILSLIVAATSVSHAQNKVSRSRSAKTGQYVSGSYAKKHPSTTVTERTVSNRSAAAKRRK